MKVVTIGRSKEHNDIVVNDDKVSRNHLQMIMDDNGNISVVDLNSTNGTFVNGQRITGEVPLKDTDELKIGYTILPWQSYFCKSSNTVPNKTVSSQSSDSPQQSISTPTPKPWLKYVLIGLIVVVLLIGGGVGWMIYQKRDLKEKWEAAQKNLAEKKSEYKYAVSEYKNAKNQLDSIREKDPHNQEALAAAEERVTRTGQAVANAQTGLNDATENVNTLTSKQPQETKKPEKKQEQQGKTEKPKEAEQNLANNEVQQSKPQLSDPNNKQNQSEKDKPKPKEGASATEQYQAMINILNKWGNEECDYFCSYMEWQAHNKENARKMISEEKFNSRDVNRDDLINKMKEFDKYSKTEKKRIAEQKERDFKNRYQKKNKKKR